MKWSRNIAVAAVAVLLLGSTALAQETIKVGVVGPRTGLAAATGAAFEEGIKRAYLGL